MAVSDPHGLLGMTIAEKYVVERVVGAGGFAIVYRARHLIFNRPVALKLFQPIGGNTTGGEHGKLLEGFLREGALLAELSEISPAICQARDVGTVVSSGGMRLPYLVLEWLEGMSLAEVLTVEATRSARPRTLAEAVSLLEPVAHALALAHERGIVHRDVKPGNIFVLGDPREPGCAVKLLDFGVAKVLSDARSTAGALAATVGPLSAFTPYYAAPEQFSRAHGPTGPWTDVYALALVLVELATGRDPQEGSDLPSVAASATNPNRRPTPRTLGAAVGDEVEAVFRVAFSIDARDRYASAAVFWVALRSAMGLEPLSGPGLGPRSARGSSPSHVIMRAALASSPTLDAPPSAPAASSLVTPTPQVNERKGRTWWLATIGCTVLAVSVASWHFTRGSAAGAASLQPLPVSHAPSTTPPAVSRSAASSSLTCPATMVAVPGGAFYMGDDEGTKLERPTHHVRLDPFCIDRFEVTVSAYKSCSDMGECKRGATTNEWDGIDERKHATFDPLCNVRDPAGHGQHPINCVDWAAARYFCRSEGARLPTEAEWEFAARGPDGRRYPWGDEPPSATLLNACGTECVAWGKVQGEEERAMFAADDGWATTAPVGSFPAGASPYGLQDVVGNVWEWVDDWFAPYDGGDQKNPEGPATGTEKVIRGGAWNGADPSWVRPTFRYRDAPGKRSYGIGFRCARSSSDGG